MIANSTVNTVIVQTEKNSDRTLVLASDSIVFRLKSKYIFGESTTLKTHVLKVAFLVGNGRTISICSDFEQFNNSFNVLTIVKFILVLQEHIFKPSNKASISIPSTFVLFSGLLLYTYGGVLSQQIFHTSLPPKHIG